MAFDEGLAERIRGILEERERVSERRMFGGLAFMVGGHMVVGILKDQLMVRVSPEDHGQFLQEPHARAMDFTGRPMKGLLFVSSEGLESDRDLERWVERGLARGASLPAKDADAMARPKKKRVRAKVRASRTRRT